MSITIHRLRSEYPNLSFISHFYFCVSLDTIRLLFITICLAVGAAASQSQPLAKRDLETITSVLQNVESNIEGLYKVASTGNADPAPLLKASDSLIKSITNGKIQVDGTKNISFVDTVHLIKPVHDLSTISAKLVDSMESIKSSVEEMKLCDVVRIQVSNINNGSTALIKAVNSKVPEAALDISNALAQGIIDALAKSQNEFSAENCVNGRKEANSTAKSGSSTTASVNSATVFISTMVLLFLSVSAIL